MASSSLFDSFKNTVKNLELPLQKSFLFTVVLGLKQLVNRVVFECPEHHYTPYSLLFIIVPAVGLLCLALMISWSFWKNGDKWLLPLQKSSWQYLEALATFRLSLRPSTGSVAFPCFSWQEILHMLQAWPCRSSS